MMFGDDILVPQEPANEQSIVPKARGQSVNQPIDARGQSVNQSIDQSLESRPAVIVPTTGERFRFDSLPQDTLADYGVQTQATGGGTAPFDVDPIGDGMGNGVIEGAVARSIRGGSGSRVDGGIVNGGGRSDGEVSAALVSTTVTEGMR